MAGNLKSKISDWLDKHGYPFEMFVANIFQSKGFQVAQSVMYLDQETRIPRELDIVAHKTYMIKNLTFSFAVVIECKATKSKPWISFIVNSPSSIDLINQHSNCTKDADLFLRYLSANNLKINNLFPEKISRFGYSLTQALRENDGVDTTFKALQTLSKSTEYFIKKLDKRGKSLAFYFPVIAIDCPLFEAELLNNNEIDLEEVETTTYLGRQVKGNNLYFIVDIVTRNSIEAYTNRVCSMIDDFMNLHKDNIDKFTEEYNTIF